MTFGAPIRTPWELWRPEIEGWSSDILPFYEAIADELPDGAHMAEIGVYRGRSILYLAEAMARRGKTASLYAVDFFEAPWAKDMWESFCAHLDTSPAEARKLVHPCKGGSVEVAKEFGSASLDMIFIDGDHAYESVARDITAWAPKVKPGGIICGHDYSGDEYGSFPGVDQAVHEAFGKDRILRPGGAVWRVQ